MKLKNYQEDIVLHLIELILQEQSQKNGYDEFFINDVAAYTLNRLKPKYIMSERGVTRFISSNLDDSEPDTGLSEYVKIMLLINHAVWIVQSRRTADVQGTADPHEEIMEGVHNYPFMVGKVINPKDRIPAGAELTLMLNGELAVSAEPGWPNPYVLHEHTKGYYSFWPAPSSCSQNELEHYVEIIAKHPEYGDRRVETTLTTTKEPVKTDAIQDEHIFELPICRF